MDKLFYTIDEVCAQLTICRSGYYKLNKEGKVPSYVKIGSRSVVPRKNIEEWADNENRKRKGANVH